VLMEQVLSVSNDTPNNIVPYVKIEMPINKYLRVGYCFIVKDFPLVSVHGITHCLSQEFDFYVQNVKGSRIKK
jgi:hypothetical protein